MAQIESSIQPFIASQFPEFYREESPLFVEFVKQYYAWMETQDKPLYYSRNFLTLQNVDTTTDDILVYIKEKYLVNIQLSTQANIRQIIKHALDIYRSKGTERCIDLLFRLVFNEVVSFYYPKNDLFRTSDGEWKIPKYIELSLSSTNVKLQHKQVIGVQSGATAFVDDVVRRVVQNRLIDVAYISAIDGSFQYGEYIRPVDLSIDLVSCPKMVGSLQSITLNTIGTGQGFSIGDIVNIYSSYGEQGQARVANTTSQIGVISLNLQEGGYGYSTTANVIVSNTILTVANIHMTNTYSRVFNQTFDVVTQPLANISYNSANGLINVGDFIYTYYANSTINGQGQVLIIPSANTTAGRVICSILSGNLNSNTIYTTSNVIAANVVSYVNNTANGNFIISNNVTLNLNSIVGTFLKGETIIQNNKTFLYDTALIGQATVDTLITSNSMSLNSISGVFNPNTTLRGLTSNATANVTNISMTLGVANLNSFGFISGNNTYITSPRWTGNIISTSLITSTDFAVVNNMIYTEIVQVNSDLLSNWIANLNAATYPNFPANTSANSGTIFSNMLSWSATLIGKPTQLKLIQVGFQQDVPPLGIVSENVSKDMNLFDKTLTLIGTTGSFTNGEIVTQASSSARGLIQSGSNTTLMYIQELRYNANNRFVPTTNAATQIIGVSSGTIANVVSVTIKDNIIPSGLNAVLTAASATGNGNVTELQILDSGFGYINGEQIWFDKTNNFTVNSGIGYVSLQNYGKGTGFFREKGGFLSDQKKLFDGDYYQNFSYEISSGETLDKYQDMLDKIGHVAGTKVFARYVHKQVINAPPIIKKMEITVA